MSSLKSKRKQVLITILIAVCAIGVVMSTPQVNLESSKKIFMTIANVGMCLTVWNIYFDEQLSKKGTVEIILDLIVITAIATTTAYITAKAILSTIGTVIAWFGLFGWGVIGLMAGAVTSLLGIGWAIYCEDIYRNPSS